MCCNRCAVAIATEPPTSPRTRVRGSERGTSRATPQVSPSRATCRSVTSTPRLVELRLRAFPVVFHLRSHPHHPCHPVNEQGRVRQEIIATGSQRAHGSRIWSHSLHSVSPTTPAPTPHAVGNQQCRQRPGRFDERPGHDLEVRTPLRCDQRKSKRSRFMTLTHDATKSVMNFS